MGETWTLFDRLADRYDEVIPFFAELATRTLDVVGPSAGDRLLDIGTGRGAIAVAAAARGCVVTATDAAPRMIERLSAGYPELDARVMDAHGLDFPDASFDLATGGFMIHLVSDPVRVLAELRRVIRPGGLVALTGPGDCEDDGRWDGFHELVGEYGQRVDTSHFPAKPFELDQVTEAGFTGLTTTEIEVHLPVPDPQTCWDFHMSHGFAGFVESLSPADAAEFREKALAEFARMHANGGIIVDRGAVVHVARVPAGS
ncbi:class I SAM-dependent methyltransferase [Longispora albida]|uniref:class I SAM-dependent methyltransferase n=1 Tax=Longispora albida TaxID=203523 RepID=UPI0003625201|nr:class I SAM-dependent methyltransferase [Longispora albida]